VAFPIVQTNAQQDPVISFCYMGDYNKHRLQRHDPVRHLGRQPQRGPDVGRARKPAGRVPAELLRPWTRPAASLAGLVLYRS
jgi:hypothetical protein